MSQRFPIFATCDIGQEALRGHSGVPQVAVSCEGQGSTPAMSASRRRTNPRFARTSPWARFHYRAGQALALWGWHGGAAQAFRDALGIDPAFAEAHFHLGEALGRRGRWKDASEAFRRATQIQPWNAEAQGNLVIALGRAGLLTPAIAAVERLIELRPREPELYVLLGALLRKAGRHERAIHAFRWAVGLPRSSPTARCFLGEALLGPHGWAAVWQSYSAARGLELWDRRPERGRSPLNHPPAAAPESRTSRKTRSQRLPRPRLSWTDLGRPFMSGTKYLAGLCHLAVGRWHVLLDRVGAAQRPHAAIRSFRQASLVRARSH